MYAKLSIAASAAVLLLAAGASAQAAAKAPAGPVGLTGLWLLNQDVYDKQTESSTADKFPSLTAAAQAKAEADRKATTQGGQVLSDNGRLCLPIGMPGMVTNEFALKFLETPGEVTVVSENSPLVRTIYLNEKSHPADYDPTWNGHSIGHWETNGEKGKTLVVDTVGLNDRTGHIAGARGARSLTTHIVERYHLEDGGKSLVNVMTFDDPNVLTKPWTMTYRYHRADKGAELWEYVCEVDAPGWSERFKGDPAYKPGSSGVAPK